MDDEFEFELPLCIQLKPSKSMKNELGAFTNTHLNADQFLGSFKGKIRNSITQCVDPEYAWTILSSRQMPLFCIDASDPKDSNWLRFIRSTADTAKYNVICMQQNQQINYFTLKNVESDEELVTYVPSKKKQNSKGRSDVKSTTYTLVDANGSDQDTNCSQQAMSVKADDEPNSDETQSSTGFFNGCHQCLLSFASKSELKKHIQDCKSFVSSSSSCSSGSSNEGPGSGIEIVTPTPDVDNLSNSEAAAAATTAAAPPPSSSSSSLNTLDTSKPLIPVAPEPAAPQTDDAIDEATSATSDDVDDEDDTTTTTATMLAVKKPTSGSSQASSGSNDEVTAKFTCTFCKQKFDDRLALSKHQRTELQLKLEKKKKEMRKKKLREQHFKHKIDLSYIETTQLSTLTQQVADNLAFCIDGTSEDLKSYTKEVKDYIQTELGVESDIHMFLKCFPELYEKLAVKHSPNLDINLCRKANTYFANCFYVPFKRDSSLQQQWFHCKMCKTKVKTLFELIRHQRTEHNVTSLKTMFEANEQPVSPIGYLRCDPYAYILNLYWDMTYEKECDKCKQKVLRTAYAKHLETCESGDGDGNGDGEGEGVVSGALVEIADEPMVCDVEKKPIENAKEELVEGGEPAMETDGVEEVTDKGRRKRQMDDLSLNNVMTNKRRVVGVQSSRFADENYVFFGGATATIQAVASPTRTREKRTKQVDTVTVKSEDSVGQEVPATSLVREDVATEQSSKEPEVQRRKRKSKSVKPEDVTEEEKAEEEREDEEVNKPVLTIEEDAESQCDKTAEQDEPQPQQRHLEKRISTRIKKLSLKRIEADLDNAILAAASQSKQQQQQQQGKTEPQSQGAVDVVAAPSKKQQRRKSSFDSVKQQQQRPQDDIVHESDAIDSEPEEPFSNQQNKKQKKDESDESPMGYTNCDKCGLPFTSLSSVLRHRKASCIGMPIINIPTTGMKVPKKKCPACDRVFLNTHSISVHIHKYHFDMLSGVAGKAVVGQVKPEPPADSERRVEMASNKPKRLIIKFKKSKTSMRIIKRQGKRSKRPLKKCLVKSLPVESHQSSTNNTSTSITHISDLTISSMSLSMSNHDDAAPHTTSQAVAPATVTMTTPDTDDELKNPEKKFKHQRTCPKCKELKFKIKKQYRKHLSKCGANAMRSEIISNTPSQQSNVDFGDFDMKSMFKVEYVDGDGSMSGDGDTTSQNRSIVEEASAVGAIEENV